MKYSNGKTRHKVEANRREAETNIHAVTAEIRELVLTFLERLSHNALPKNRKRETLDACIKPDKVQRVSYLF